MNKQEKHKARNLKRKENRKKQNSIIHQNQTVAKSSKRTSFILNENFVEDKNYLYKIFNNNNKRIPRYFIEISNLLKNKNLSIKIFQQVQKYINGNFKITDLVKENIQQKKKRQKKKYKVPYAWIVKSK